jgi:hypothetical protein
MLYQLGRIKVCSRQRRFTSISELCNGLRSSICAQRDDSASLHVIAYGSIGA